MTKILANILRYITLISVLCGQLLWPYYAYAGVGQQLYPVILNAAINGTKMAGAVATRVIAGNPAIGIAMTSNPAGDANYDCMVAINPACLPLPTNWTRDASTQKPVPPAVQPMIGNFTANGTSITAGSDTGLVSAVAASNGYTVKINNGCSPASGSFYMCSYQTTEGDYFNFLATKQLTCPPGYAINADNMCGMIASDPSAVPKPSGTPCSIVRNGNTFSFDNTNPVCNNATNGQYVMSDGNIYDASSGNVIVYPSWDDVKNKNPAATVTPTVDGGTQVKSYDRASNTTTTTTIKDGKVVSSTTEVGNTTGNAGTGTGTGGTQITCQQVGTCGVSQEATQQKVEANTKAMTLSMQQIASGLAMGEPIPGITPGDYAGAVDQFHNMLPKPDDYRGPVGTMLKAMGFPEGGGGQCSLTRTVTLFGRSITIQFVPNGICGPYQQVANWVTWGLVAIMAWQQIKSLAGDKSELSGGK
ncbi:hypothetical protein JW897_23985 [Chromobacterium alkanivorans]|uniref:hypothetical protein n=1 Tax=Chromobacterium alkanivorans TaxID=1071719 RepID=UPI00196884C1|nr:hypothetical protein [Chromobacterium alkanivorans]MBN3006803.1 hypothetical protein [Chromobacterium alkanivorans]